MASGTNGESETKPRAVCAFHCANRAPALAPGTSETGARLRSIGRARKWLRRSRRTRLRVIEGVGVEREDALKVLSGHHSQSRCRARGRGASTVPGGRRAATNGSFESTPAVRSVSREGPEPAQTCRYRGDQRMRKIGPRAVIAGRRGLGRRGWWAIPRSSERAFANCRGASRQSHRCGLGA